MTIYLTPNITDEQIAAMDSYDAFRKAEELLDSRYPRDAVRVVRRVVEDEPGNAAAWELLGRAHFAAAQLTPAEQAFRRLIELEPTSGWAHTALGLTLGRQSRPDEAATMHRLATAMGESPRDTTRVALVEHDHRD
jgi:Flp pilus assembly protein TadD